MSRDRQAPSLGWPPSDPQDLKGFSSQALTPDTPLFRIVSKGRGPWWFGSTMRGRFDLPKPDGTCYLASDEVSALLEAVGADRMGGLVPAELLETKRLRELRVPREMSLSDLTSRQAIRFGITAEVGTIVPYDCPQAWAARLREAGSSGIIYWLRHDPSGSKGYALFGSHGERRRWKRGRERRISQGLIEKLQEETGLEVVGIPRADELRILKPS